MMVSYQGLMINKCRLLLVKLISDRLIECYINFIGYMCNNILKIDKFNLIFLMMRSALFGGSGVNKFGHGSKNFIRSSRLFI
jgi:hypothetical protein